MVVGRYLYILRDIAHVSPDFFFSGRSMEPRSYYYFRAGVIFQKKRENFFKMRLAREIRHSDYSLHFRSSFGKMLSSPSMQDGSRDFFSRAICFKLSFPYIISRNGCFSFPMPCSADTVPPILTAFFANSMYIPRLFLNSSSVRGSMFTCMWLSPMWPN